MAALNEALVALIPGASLGPAGHVGAALSLNTNTTSASNVGTGETDLITYSLPAGSLNANGQKVRITVWGSEAANANTKTIRLYFGSTVLVTQTNTSSGVVWRSIGLVVRTGAATQIGESDLVVAGYSAAAHTQTTPAETLSGAVTIKVTGQSGTGSNDITALGMFIEWIP